MMTRKLLNLLDKLKIFTLLAFNLEYNLMSKEKLNVSNNRLMNCLNVIRSKLGKKGLAQDVTIT
jgi:hypothetical protein